MDGLAKSSVFYLKMGLEARWYMGLLKRRVFVNIRKNTAFC
jgi:hypothetical protein